MRQSTDRTRRILRQLSSASTTAEASSRHSMHPLQNLQRAVVRRFRCMPVLSAVLPAEAACPRMQVNSLCCELACDPESESRYPNRKTRAVRSGQWVRVEPTPLPKPYLVAFRSRKSHPASRVANRELILCSADMSKRLGLSASDVASTEYSIQAFVRQCHMCKHKRMRARNALSNPRARTLA